jgi:molecular chaperone HscB
LSAQVQAVRTQLLQQCEDLLDQQHAYAKAVAPVRALMFVEKFTQDVNQRFEQFE